MSLQTDFEQAAVRVKSLGEQSNDVLLQLYGLFKQASTGDVQGEEPGMFDFVGKAKYDSWATRRGLSKDAAMQAYIELVDKLGGGKR